MASFALNGALWSVVEAKDTIAFSRFGIFKMNRLLNELEMALRGDKIVA